MYVCGHPTVPAKTCRPKTFFRKNLQKVIDNLLKNFYVSSGATTS